jgi:hypothetical protein
MTPIKPITGLGGGLAVTHIAPTADEKRLASKKAAQRKAKPVEVPTRFSVDWPPGFVSMTGKRGRMV